MKSRQLTLVAPSSSITVPATGTLPSNPPAYQEAAPEWTQPPCRKRKSPLIPSNRSTIQLEIDDAQQQIVCSSLAKKTAKEIRQIGDLPYHIFLLTNGGVVSRITRQET